MTIADGKVSKTPERFCSIFKTSALQLVYCPRRFGKVGGFPFELAAQGMCFRLLLINAEGFTHPYPEN